MEPGNHITRINTAFYAAVFIALFGVIEALFGLWSGSLTLLSDAGHMGADALALTLAAFASWIKHRPTTPKHTYGFGRVEVLASWLSSMLLLAIIVSITIEAIHRLHTPTVIASKPVMIVATIGLIVNIITAWILHKGEKTLNTQAALLHVMGDLLGSVAVLISGIIIYFTNWTLIDPILSIFICLLILISTINLLRKSSLVLMEGTPSNIDFTEVSRDIKTINGVKTIHDLHIWTLTSGVILLTVHVIATDNTPWPQIIDDVRAIIQKNFGITHSTIQIESPNQAVPCVDCNSK
ncbi:MAG: cation diffusion facilitator family transporter [Gammaproteobacteria bacterium]|nr:cation diffusion facilitator family transporter [Gammaproteobacteria bacterium]